MSSDTEPYGCSFCSYTSRIKKDLSSHVAEMHADRSFRCDVCGFITKYQANYYRHRRTLHGVDSIHICELCATRCPTKEAMLEHTRATHPDIIDIVSERLEVVHNRICQQTGATSFNEDEEDEASEEESEDSNPARKKKPEGEKRKDGSSGGRVPHQRSYICRDCEYVTRDATEYLTHRKDVHGERLRIYSCTWCTYASVQIQRLQRHASSLHPEISPEDQRIELQRIFKEVTEAAQIEKETQIIAHLLEKSGNQEDQLLRTKALVKTVRLPIALSDAEGSASTSNSEDSNKNKNNIAQWFTCSQCQFKARSRKIVEDHERTSHGVTDEQITYSVTSENKLTCDSCGYTCKDIERFDTHVKFHQLAKLKTNGSFRCDLCEYRCNSKQLLKSHMNHLHQLQLNALCGGGNNMGGLSMPTMCFDEGEMEGSSIGIDEGSADMDDTEAVTCDLCGSCFLNQTDLLEHTRKEHMNDVEAEQSSMLRRNRNAPQARPQPVHHVPQQIPQQTLPSQGASQNDTLALLQSRLGLSITALTPPAPTPPPQQRVAPPAPKPAVPVVIELGNGNSLKRLMEGNGSSTPPAVSQAAAAAKPAVARSGTIFKCRYCPFSTKTKQEYTRHEATHKPMTCPLCPFKTLWKNDLNKHMTGSHPGMEVPSASGLQIASTTSLSEDGVMTTASGGVLRNLLSAPEVLQTNAANKQQQQQSLLFKSLQGNGAAAQQKLTEERAAILPGQEDIINNPQTKLPANAHYHCPYCNFITKTASRFHVHYMQHLNLRPYECSVCRIKSNWLWDINKHIRTRVQQGDGSHKTAKCVCVNEAGLRDYNKYKMFIKEGPASGESIESTDEQGEAGVVAAAEAVAKQQMQQNSFSGRSAASNGKPPLAGVTLTGGVQVQVSRDDNSQNYMIQQMQKLQTPAKAAAVTTATNGTMFRIKNVPTAVKPDAAAKPNAASNAARGGNVMSCGHCDYTCEHRDIMLGHLGAHADVLPFICSKCGLASKWHHTAWIHLQQFHRGSNVTLQDIRLQLDYKQNGAVFTLTDANQVVHAVIGPLNPNGDVSSGHQLKCDRCPYHTVQKSNMAKHMEGHQRTRPSLMKYKCFYCDFWQENRRAILRHMTLHKEYIKGRGQNVTDEPENEEQITPEITNGTTKTMPIAPGILVQQMIENANKQITGENGNNDGKELKCDACPFVTNNNSQFIYHKQFHRPNPKAKFKCDKCSFWGSHSNMITQHSKVHQPLGVDSTKYPEGSWLPPAEIAVPTEATSSNKIRSFKIMKNGIVVKMYKCRFCPMMNKTKINISIHELTHKDDAQGAKYHCHLCSFKSAEQPGLGEHLRTHLGNKTRETGVHMLGECPEEDVEEIGDTELALLQQAAALAVTSVATNASATPVSAAGIQAARRPSAGPAPKIKYNCSSVESELFNLLQSRQNGQIIRTNDDEGPPKLQTPRPIQSSQNQMVNQNALAASSSGLARVKKTTAAQRRSDGLITFASKINQRKWIACSECPALFMNPTEYTRHLDHHYIEDKFQCSKCNYSSNKFAFVSQHEQVHTAEYMMKKLGYCHRPTTGPGGARGTPADPPSVLNASASAATTSQSPAKKEPAKIIKSVTPKKPGTQSGVPLPHLSEDAVKNVDTETFSVSLLMAELHESRAVFEGTSSGSLRCISCPALFANQAVLQFHQKLHQKQSRLRCHVCSYSVDDNANMSAHAQLHYLKHEREREKRPVLSQKPCPKCPASFSKNSFLESHLQRHGSGERYQCDFCDFASNKSDTLTKHRSVHKQNRVEKDKWSGEENLDANSQICVGTLFRNASVPQAIEEDGPTLPLDRITAPVSKTSMHDEEKRVFACTSCPYTYARKDGMLYHTRRHTTRQQFDCPHCGFSVNTATGLRDHIKTHFQAQKMNKPNAFVHYDDIKIICEGEVIFEDKGRLDKVRFFPEEIPQFKTSPPELLIEYLHEDIIDTVKSIVDNVCSDKRKQDRENVATGVVRRSSSQRNSQDEPPRKRSRSCREYSEDSSSQDSASMKKSHPEEEDSSQSAIADAKEDGKDEATESCDGAAVAGESKDEKTNDSCGPDEREEGNGESMSGEEEAEGGESEEMTQDTFDVEDDVDEDIADDVEAEEAEGEEGGDGEEIDEEMEQADMEALMEESAAREAALAEMDHDEEDDEEEEELEEGEGEEEVVEEEGEEMEGEEEDGMIEEEVVLPDGEEDVDGDIDEEQEYLDDAIDEEEVEEEEMIEEEVLEDDAMYAGEEEVEEDGEKIENEESDQVEITINTCETAASDEVEEEPKDEGEEEDDQNTETNVQLEKEESNVVDNDEDEQHNNDSVDDAQENNTTSNKTTRCEQNSNGALEENNDEAHQVLKGIVNKVALAV